MAVLKVAPKDNLMVVHLVGLLEQLLVAQMAEMKVGWKVAHSAWRMAEYSVDTTVV